jgi:hypothetical protein
VKEAASILAGKTVRLEIRIVLLSCVVLACASLIANMLILSVALA